MRFVQKAALVGGPSLGNKVKLPSVQVARPYESRSPEEMKHPLDRAAHNRSDEERSAPSQAVCSASGPAFGCGRNAKMPSLPQGHLCIGSGHIKQFAYQARRRPSVDHRDCRAHEPALYRCRRARFELRQPFGEKRFQLDQRGRKAFNAFL